MLQIARWAVVIGSVFLLSGCYFVSDYDISKQMKAEFPIATGQYETENGTHYSVTRENDYYMVAENQDAYPVVKVRFFHDQDAKDYIVQMWDDSGQERHGYTYFYAEIDKKKIVLKGPASPSTSSRPLPPDIEPMVYVPYTIKEIFPNPKLRSDIPEPFSTSYFWVIANGQADTLHVLREVASREALFRSITFVHQ